MRLRPAEIVLVIAVSAVSVAGCRQAGQSTSVDDPARRIAAIPAEMREDESDDAYRDRVEAEARKIVSSVELPPALRELYYECERRGAADLAQHSSQEELKRLSPFFEAQRCIIFRLGELGTPEAAAALLDLYADESLAFDAEMGLNVGVAITQCGKNALPYLNKLRGRVRPTLTDALIACVEQGQIFGR